jgi:hypothetical protein
MQTKGSTFRPSVNPKRVVSSSKSVYVEDLIESLESTGITFVIIAAAGTKCQHTSLNDLVQNLHSQYGLGNGFLDLATYLEPNDSDVMPLLSASPSLNKGTTSVFPMFSYIGNRLGSVLWTGSPKSGMVKLKVYPSLLHQLKLAISGRADLQYPSSSISCLKRRTANLQRCLRVLNAQRAVKQKVRVEFRVRLSELTRVTSAFKSVAETLDLLKAYMKVSVFLLPIDDIIKQATAQHALLSNRLVAANGKRATKQQIQLYCDCVSSMGFSYPALLKHAFKNPVRNVSSKLPIETQRLAQAQLKRAATMTKLKSTTKKKNKKTSSSTTLSDTRDRHASLLLQKYQHEFQKRQPQPQPHPQPHPELQPQPEPHPHPEPEPQPEAQPHPHPQPHPQIQPVDIEQDTSTFLRNLEANEILLNEIRDNVAMKVNKKWKKCVCYLRGGGVAATALDEHELAQVILVQYGASYKDYLVCF